MKRIGVISDTHGLLRPEARAFLRGSDLIIHGGDIGDPAILKELGALAPVTAVRGNNDQGRWAEAIRETEVLQVEGVSIYVLHDLGELDLDPAAAGFRVVVSGHSHKPAVKEERGVLFLNPGSAGPRRFKLPDRGGAHHRRRHIRARLVHRARHRRTSRLTASRRAPSALRRRPCSIYTHVYTLVMSERAKLFRNGGSQAVRLPKSCRFKDELDEVIVHRRGKQVILEPADEWPADFLACLGAWTDDIPRPPRRAVGSRKNPFERP